MSANLIYKPTASLQRSRSAQPGGLCSIYFTPVENILTLPIPDTSSGIVASNFILKPGKSWHTAMAPFKKAYKEEQRVSEAGPFMEVTITAFIPFDTKAAHFTLDRLKYHRYIVIVTRADKTMRIIGNLDYPASFSHSTDLGETRREQPGTIIQFICNLEDKPLLYTGAVSPVA